MPLYSMLSLLKPGAQTLKNLPTIAGAACSVCVRQGGVVRSILDQGVKPLLKAVRCNDTYEKFKRARIVNFNFYGNPSALKDVEYAWRDAPDVLRVTLHREPHRGSADLEQRCLVRAQPRLAQPTLEDFAGGLAGLDGGEGGDVDYADDAAFAEVDALARKKAKIARHQAETDRAILKRRRKTVSTR